MNKPLNYPVATDPIRSRIMKSNKAKNTKPELRVRGILAKNRVKGYKLNYGEIPGSPDIAFPYQKVAIFVNGCFWHRCPICKPGLPKINREFWKAKFAANEKRDELKTQSLQSMGWSVLVIWECEIEKNLGNCCSRILTLLK
jgi:DNA mismatch endonuclease (patch repair protein)